MLFLYAFGTIFLYPILFLATFFSSNAKLFWKKRKDSLERLKTFKKQNDASLYWLHASSVGELDQCKSIAKVIRAKEPKSQIIQSVFSNSVTDSQLTNPLFDFAFHLPLDFPGAYNFYFQTFRPKVLIVTAWDTWPILFATAHKFNVKTFLVCASLHSRSGRLRFPGRLFAKKAFSYLDGIMPSSDILRPLFTKITQESKIGPSADSRFDAVIEKIESRPQPPILPKVDSRVLIFASTYEFDEDMIFPYLYNFTQSGYQIWIFPHKVDSANIERISERLKSLQLNFSLYSKIEEIKDRKVNIVLFDKIGILAHAYEFGYYAYVGGAFHHRVHNVTEPAYFGLPIITGPKIQHSAEALTLQALGGLFVVNDSSEYHEIHLRLTQEIEVYEEIKLQNSQYVRSQKGSSIKIYEYIAGKS
jgi:3-deoxy-D-manno-octulosonic-acid transferase